MTTSSATDPAPRPNIVYLHSHDTGRELSPYGAPVRTPHLQALAEDGTVFRQAFSTAPTCSPSRAGLLTGQWPHQSGMLGLAHRGHRLTHPERHLATTLGHAGYTTVLAGLQHLTPEDEVASMGYQQVIGTARDAETAAAGFIESRPSEPYFLDVGFFETHRHGTTVAFHVDQVHGDSRWAPAPPGLPDTPATRSDYADYAASAATLDSKIGVVIEALAQTGQLATTLVIVTTDHGIPFPGAKCNVNDRGLGVALILGGLAQVSGGRVVDAMVSHLDLYPSICELADTAIPDWVEGRSLWPLLTGAQDRVHDELYGEVTFHVEYEPMRSVRTDRYRYIRRFAEQHHPMLSHCDAGLSKTQMLELGWADTSVDQELLFDLTFDPGEVNNIVADPARSAVAEDLRQRLADWMVRTDDPILHGKPFEPSHTKAAEVQPPLEK